MNSFKYKCGMYVSKIETTNMGIMSLGVLKNIVIKICTDTRGWFIILLVHFKIISYCNNNFKKNVL